MDKLSIIAVIAWAVGLCGCGGNAGGGAVPHTDEVNDSIDLCIEADSYTVYMTVDEEPADSVATMTPAELMELMSTRMKLLGADPLNQNVWGTALEENAVVVDMSINTPYWQERFRKLIADSPLLRFEGPSKPVKISSVVDSVVRVEGVCIVPDSDAYAVDAVEASFKLVNDGERTITFGDDYIVGYRGDDGEWYRLPNPGIWNDIGYSMSTGGRHAIAAKLHPALNRNRPGTYRLYKSMRFDDDDARQYFWLMTEFRLR